MRFSGIYFGGNKNNSLEPKKLLKKHIFEKKSNLSNEKIFVVYFFLVLSNMKMSGNIL